MKNKAKKLIRNILIGAVASLYSTNTQAKESATVSFLDNLNDDDKKDAVNALKNKIFRNVLQITKKGDIKLIAGHRSHMSHRSGGGGGGGHYSHASHFSSYGGGDIIVIHHTVPVLIPQQYQDLHLKRIKRTR